MCGAMRRRKDANKKWKYWVPCGLSKNDVVVVVVVVFVVVVVVITGPCHELSLSFLCLPLLT